MTEVLPASAAALGPVPYLRAHPGPALFARRAARLAALAPGHAAGDYLEFLALVAEGQHAAALALRPARPAPGGAPGGRPLACDGPLDPAWRGVLERLLAHLSPAPLPPAARATLDRLAALPAAALDRLAGAALAGRLAPGEVAAAPLLGASLQVVFAAAAAGLAVDEVRRAEGEGCPACGFPPVVGVVLGDDKLRYLWCGLCATAWHHTRVQCTRCRSSARLEYLAVEGSDGTAKAEQCDGCEGYLKLLHAERAPGLEPWADDLATLPLDLLMAGRGAGRLGVNLMLVPAAGEGGYQGAGR